jgi:hypothetical protein
VRIVLGQVIDDARESGVHLATAQFFGADHLAGGGLHEWRPAEKNRALVAHDDRLVAHRGHVRAACGARTHHDGDLRNAGGRHVRLVVENAAEVILVGEHFVLARQVCAARVHQVDAWQPVFLCHALRAQMFLDADRIVSTALHGRVVAHDQAFAPRHAPDARNDSGGRRFIVVHAEGREWRQFEKRGAGVEQHFHPVAGQQLAAGDVLRAGRLASAQPDPRLPGLQFVDQRTQRSSVGCEFSTFPIDFGFEHRHDCRTIVQSGI